MTRIAAVIGWPVEHARSPAIVNAAFTATGIDAHMIAVAAPPARLAAEIQALRAGDMLGASVTLPHKIAAAALCDALDPDARQIGAVNCLALHHARQIGHNTDAAGFCDALVAAGVSRRD